MLLTSSISIAQTGRKWSLNECIEYALNNNIEIKNSVLTINEASETLKQAKSSVLPSLTISSSQTLVNQKTDDGNGNFSNSGSYSGSYSLNSGITIYNGGVLKNSIKQKELLQKSSELTEEELKNSIQENVTQAFLQILYARESVNTNKESVELSKVLLIRAKAFYDSGSISSVDYAQFESQLSNDNYNLTLSQNTLNKSKLALKQMLELGIDQEFDILVPEINDSEIIKDIPTVSQVYNKAIETKPQIENSKLAVESAKLTEKISQAATLPVITANASIGTGNSNNSGYTFSEQLNNRMSQNIGVTISIPIFNKRSAKTQINISKLQTESAILKNLSVQKELLNTIESLYQEALSSQSRYLASVEKLKYYNQSFNLINEQFNSGMKNTVELMTERKNLIQAQQELIESKFQSILSLKLLKFYQNELIEL